MAYYDALIAAWNGTTQPPTGVTGTALTAGMTSQQKLDAVNAWTVAGAAKVMIVPTYSIYNCIVPSEFAALTATNQQLIRDILSLGIVDASPGTSVRTRIVTAFPSGTTTFTNLADIAKQYDTPQVLWWQSIGAPGPIGRGDLINAGGLI